MTDLKDEIKKLEDHEQLLDMHTQWIQQSIKNIENDLINRKYAYITYEDVKENFPDDFVLGIQAPPDTELSVPNISQVSCLLKAGKIHVGFMYISSHLCFHC